MWNLTDASGIRIRCMEMYKSQQLDCQYEASGLFLRVYQELIIAHTLGAYTFLTNREGQNNCF